MKLLSSFRALVATLTVSSVVASPFQSLEARDVFVPSTTCDTLGYGATKIPFGTVCVGISTGTMTVQYNLDAGWTINNVHVLVSTAVPTITAPGQFPYQNGAGCTVSGSTATCTFPIQNSWRGCGTTLYIATHVDASSAAAGQVTGWGLGTCYDNKGNCAKYWTFTESCICPVIYSYTPITSTSTSYTTLTSTSTYYVTSTSYSTITSTSSSEIVATYTFPPLTTTTSCGDSLAPVTTSVIGTTTTL